MDPLEANHHGKGAQSTLVSGERPREKRTSWRRTTMSRPTASTEAPDIWATPWRTLQSNHHHTGPTDRLLFPELPTERRAMERLSSEATRSFRVMCDSVIDYQTATQHFSQSFKCFSTLKIRLFLTFIKNYSSFNLNPFPLKSLKYMKNN